MLGLLFAARAVRAFAFGWLSVVLALYLAGRGLSAGQIGWAFTATMVEDALLTMLLSTIAVRLGPARVMAWTAPLISAGGVLLATAEGPWLLFAGAVLGTLSPNGQEAGPFSPMEQALLPGLAKWRATVRVFGWYNVCGFLPSALGAAAAGGWLGLRLAGGASELRAQREMLWAYAAAGAVLTALYALLASDEFRGRVPWGRVSWYWGDERFVPPDDPDSNYRMVRDAMLAKVPVPPDNVHPIPTDGTPDDAARRYERTLQEAYGATSLDPARPLFDVMLLGLGADGHTASLLPGEPVLEERRRWVAAVAHGRPEARITLTYPAIESSRRVAFLVTGPEKAPILRAIRAGDSRVPAARVRPVGELVWLVDRAAAGDGPPAHD